MDPSAPALLPFSSGTTGVPKAITLTHANLLASLADLQCGMRFTPEDRVLALAPFAHVMGSVVTLLGPLLAGAAPVTMPRFDPEGFLEIVARHRLTVVAVPPPVMRVLAFHPLVDRHDLSSVEVIACGGAALAPALQEAAQTRFADARIGVEDAAVVGVPDEQRGEAVVAFVVGDADTGALAAWLGERVAGYKRPREYRPVKTLPRTPSGKLLRRVLVEELAAVAV